MQRWRLAMIVAVVAVWWGMDGWMGPTAGPPPEGPRLLGTWTHVDEAGEVDQQLRFWQVRTELPNVLGVVSAAALDGQFEAVGLFGEPQLEGGWNDAYWDPWVINVVWDDKDGVTTAGSVALDLVDDHTLRARPTFDQLAAIQPGFMDSPETWVLTRTADAP